MRSSARGLVVAGVLGALAALSGTAVAAWAVTGTASGSAAAASLLAPTSPSAAAVSPTTSAIDISFGLPSNPTGTTYTVTRDKSKSGVAGAQVACSGLSASPCHDTGLAAGTTYTYTVTAVVGTNWVKAATVTPSAATAAATSITLTSCSDDGSNNKSTCTGTYVGAITSITITWTKAGSTAVTKTLPVSGGTFSIQSQNGLDVGTWSATATSASPAATSNSVSVTIS